MKPKLTAAVILAGCIAVPMFGQTTTGKASQTGSDEIHGSGTAQHLTKFTGNHTVGNSGVVESGGNLTTSDSLNVGPVSALVPSAPGIAVRATSTVRIRVNNYTQATPAMLAGAEREAGRILGKAGLQTVWLDCPAGHSTADSLDPCRQPLEATDIALRVLSKSSQNKFRDTTFGFAVVPVLASVYYDYVAHLARSDNAEFEIPIILGCVIAHEIGHLLLGSNSHADTGVMQGHWGRGQIRRAMTGTLLFTQEQARLIRAEAQKRIRLQTA